MKEKIFEELRNHRVLILGFGKEGQSSYRFIRALEKEMHLGIADLHTIDFPDLAQDPNVKIYTGKDYLQACYEYDLILKGPGVIIKDFLPLEIQKKITCQTDLFLKYTKNRTIGITGTKGKSTTSSLMNHILKKLGQDSLLIGNIGIPVFDVISDLKRDTICILELGVHQLEFMRYSPNIAVILNISEEHLDHYISMQKYVDAKRNIYLYQGKDDFFLCPKTCYINSLESIPSTVYRNGKVGQNYFLIEDQSFKIGFCGEERVIPISNVHTMLCGDHNLYNILVCLTICLILGFDLEKCLDTVSSFRGLPHRLEYIGTYHDILFYDDAIATGIPSVISAIEALQEVDTIILGGLDRGIDYFPLCSYLKTSTVQNIILLPETNDRIESLLLEVGSLQQIICVSNMEEAVSCSKRITQKGKICLLSPAAASYNVYRNFEEKGDHFQKLVREGLKKNED
ncbi:MAG: UDP-N-acetylmuramoyl-L-alanine--D-glutamate ligase [Bacilli bacterium]|nr:UDP-N-acetylmuramoyl-L-alanine--D-glutamate ligase [Bacilli bacterium]